MKKTLKKITLVLCVMATIFSLTLNPSSAKEIKKEKHSNATVCRTDTYPYKKYIYRKFVTSSSLKSKYFYSEWDGPVYYSGWLTLVSYQQVPGGYLCYYSGYIYQSDPGSK